MRGRVLFSEPMGQYVRLDGVTVGAWESVGSPGTPFTLELALSETTWMADALVNVLADWAEDGALVDTTMAEWQRVLDINLLGVVDPEVPFARVADGRSSTATSRSSSCRAWSDRSAGSSSS